jgi:hypothetical protein
LQRSNISKDRNHFFKTIFIHYNRVITVCTPGIFVVDICDMPHLKEFFVPSHSKAILSQKIIEYGQATEKTACGHTDI